MRSGAVIHREEWKRRARSLECPALIVGNPGEPHSLYRAYVAAGPAHGHLLVAFPVGVLRWQPVVSWLAERFDTAFVTVVDWDLVSDGARLAA